MGDELDKKQLNEASAWFSSAVDDNPDPRWLLALTHACLKKSLISEWREDGTIVFTVRALDERWRKKAVELAKEVYNLATDGIDMERGRYT